MKLWKRKQKHSLTGTNGGEIGGSVLQEQGHLLSTVIPPDAHAQNGRVERAHLTILDSVRTLLSFWAELYTVYTRN